MGAVLQIINTTENPQGCTNLEGLTEQIHIDDQILCLLISTDFSVTYPNNPTGTTTYLQKIKQ
jgi:hypothetical protein